MTFIEFRETTCKALASEPDGLTWRQLRDQLDLPYDRPCPTWVRRLEAEAGLRREPGPGRALLWSLAP